MQEEKTIDELITELGNLRVVANAAELLELDDDSYAMLRHIGFGASDSSKLLGINPYTTLNELLEEKRKLTPSDPAIRSKASVRKGKDLEDLIMKKAEKHLNITIQKPQNMYAYENTKLTVNFDGVSKLGRHLIPVEIKVCTSYGRKYYDFNKSIEEDGTNPQWKTNLMDLSKLLSVDINCGFPNYYYTQLQQQMLFLNAPYGILAVLDDYSWTMKYFMIAKNGIIQHEIQTAEIKHRWNLHPEEEIFNKIGIEKGQA